ncbi:MAG TPA: 2,3-bisphosphoglycerate-dependent phosphoglycerate mutase [Patescibacteria group bacterium]|nr:2,3-bisphosphoglycerate-dependent phosphoglycerate mutase [Patescibacteria group bacterium]
MKASKGKLILVRHAESEWNALGKWTGRTDVHLTEKGHRESAMLGQALQDLAIDLAYCSHQIRTLETLQGLLRAAGQEYIVPEHIAHLNERDYGDYTGLNKWDVLDKLGEDVFNKIRRSWDHPIPNGETLQMVGERAVPFYTGHIVPQLHAGKNVLVMSHGNTLRSLIKHIEDISDEGIADVEMPFGHILLYHVVHDGRLHHKERRIVDVVPPHA